MCVCVCVCVHVYIQGLTAEGRAKKRVQDFGPRDVTEEARETCKNWFYKVASIRDVLLMCF